jgi:hypothetical protein
MLYTFAKKPSLVNFDSFNADYIPAKIKIYLILCPKLDVSDRLILIQILLFIKSLNRFGLSWRAGTVINVMMGVQNFMPSLMKQA